MHASPTHLQQSQVDACLTDSLSTAEQQDFDDHIESCERCRDVLRTQAATQATWDGAATHLRDDADDLQKLGDDGTTELPRGHRDLIDALAPTDDPRMLGRLGPYEIAGVIGAGGMGVVLKAFDTSLSRFVAIKVLAPHLWNDVDARERFSREARAAASIVHENVIEIYGVSEANGIPFFTMPYLRGETLQQRIDNRGPLEVTEILRIAKQLADGLAAAHVQGLVHRDIKPANVLLTDGADRVRLCDFGLAHSHTEDRITHTGVLAGTPSFMSPEQVNGDRLDHRSDLFSLGSLLYTMCTGQSPFKAESVLQQLVKVSSATATRLEQVNPGIPTWLAAIVDRLLSASPNDRYQSAATLAEDLEKCLAHAQNPSSCLRPRNVSRLQTRYERAARSALPKPVLLSVVGVTTLGLFILWALGFFAQAETAIAVEGRVVAAGGKPLANAQVLAIQKTWPNNRYRQRSLSTTTDAQGRFRFERFATRGDQYAFLLSALADGHSLTSVYRLVEDGMPCKPIDLQVEPSKPVTFTIKNESGKALPGIKVLPSQRKTRAGEEYLTYAMQIKDGGVATDADGVVKLSAFQVGDLAKLTIAAGDKLSEQEFEVPATRAVALTVAVPKPADPPVSVAAKVVDADGQPVPGVKVVAIRKRWPNNRYRQDALKGTANETGELVFENFAPAGRQYAFLLTVIRDGFAMCSEYRVARDGAQQSLITLQLEPADPVTFVVRDASGNPIEGALLAPNSRLGDEEVDHLNYYLNIDETGKKTDATGKVTFSAWKAGETGSLHYRWKDKGGEWSFELGDRDVVEITLQ